MYLYNAQASQDNPLKYPPGIIIENPLPVTKKMIQSLTSAWILYLTGLTPNSIHS
jgi:hypothetical protein